MDSRPKIDRKLPPKLFFRTYLGLYQHRVDVETGSLHYIWCKLSNIILKNVAKSAPFYASIWDEFSEKYHHQKIILFNA